MRAIRWRSWVVGSMVVFAGCSTGTRQEESSAPTDVAVKGDEILNVRVGKTLDADTRSTVAFHKVNDEWRGGFTSFDSRVTPFGEIAFRGHPVTPPQAARHRDRAFRPVTAPGAEVRLNTVFVRRGAVELANGTLDVRDYDGEVVIQRGTVREVVGNAPSGVEQLWEFDGKPAGDGDLVVGVQASGAPYTGTDERGLVFQAADGTGLVYGQATWIDSTGLKTQVATRWNAAAGRIEMVVPRALVESSAYPATLDPLAMASNTTSSTYAPDTAAIGTTNVAVWENYSSGYGNLRFSLISDSTGQTGAVASKAVSSLTEQYEPAVAVASSYFAAVWRDKRTGVNNIRMTRINTAGATGGEFAVAAGSTNQFSPRVACASVSNCLVVWNEGATGSAIVRGSVVNPLAGAPTSAFTISGTVAAGVDQFAPAVATNGSGYFVAWETGGGTTSDVLGVNVTTAGATSGSVLTIAGSGANDEYAASVGYDGSNYYVGYNVFATDEDAYLQKVTPGGGLSGGAIALATGAGNQGYTSFARNGSTLLAAFATGSDVAAAPVTGGAVGSAFSISSAANGQDSPRVAFGSGTNYYAVFNDNTVVANLPSTKGTWVARGTRTTTSAAVAPTIDLSTTASPACDVVSIATSPASPQVVGTAVTVTGTAACTGGATPQYAFYLNNGTGLTLVQAYSASNTFNWNTSTYPGATYTVLVYARRNGSAATYEAQASTSYTLTGGTGICNQLSASASPGSPQAVGAAVTVTGNATCTNGETPTYQFWTNYGTGWTLKQDYSTTATWNWDTSSYPGTTVSVLVRTRRQGSASVYESQTTLSYVLTSASGYCGTLSASVSPTSPQTVGTPVTMAGSATCTGGGTPQYQYWVAPPGGFWTVLQDYSAAASYVWSTTAKPTGTYQLIVRTRALGNAGAFDAQQGFTYVLQ